MYLHSCYCHTHSLVQLLDQKLKTSRADAERLQSEKRHLEDDGQENIKQRAQLEFQVKDLEGNVEDDRSTKVSTTLYAEFVVERFSTAKTLVLLIQIFNIFMIF